jgi:hypothetical protein
VFGFIADEDVTLEARFGPPGFPFTDVPAVWDWARDYIFDAYLQDIVSGIGGTLFDPGGDFTSGMAATAATASFHLAALRASHQASGVHSTSSTAVVTSASLIVKRVASQTSGQMWSMLTPRRSRAAR